MHYQLKRQMMEQLQLKNINGYAYTFYLNNKVGKPSFNNAQEAEHFISLFERMNGISRIRFGELLTSFGGSYEQQKKALIDALLNGEIRVEQQKENKTPHTKGAVPSAPPSPPPKKKLGAYTTSSQSTETAQQQIVAEPAQQSVGAADTETCADPIVMSSGEEFLSLTDTTLQAHESLTFIRHYRSSLSDAHCGLGLGWRSNFHFALELQDDESAEKGWWFTDEFGQRTFFKHTHKGGTSVQLNSGMVLSHQPHEISISDTQGKQYRFTWKHQQWLLSKLRINTNCIYQLTYSSTPLLTGVTLNQQTKLFLQYNEQGQLVELRSGQNSDARVYATYQYDDNQQLIRATNRLGQCERYAYQHGLLTRRTRASGFSHYFKWSDNTPQAKCLEQWGDDNCYHYRFEYEEDGLSRSYDSNNHCWTYYHNSHGQCTKKVAPDGATWTFHFDSLQRKTFERLPSGLETYFIYNRQGQLSEERNNAGEQTHYAYNRLGYIIKVAHSDGTCLEQTFNTLGLITHSTDRQGIATQYEYDIEHRLIKTTCSNGINTQYWWNQQNQLIAKQVGDAVTRFSYDEWGECNGQINQAGMIVAFERNAQGRVTKQSHYHQDQPNQQHNHYYRYDNAGRLISSTDPLNRQTRYEYQGLSQIRKQINPDGSWLAFEYDRERNLTQIQRSDGAKYHLSYDSCERITKTIGFDGREQCYQYDLAGRLTQLTENSERVIKLKRNVLGLPTEQVSFGAEGTYQHNSFSFDAAKRLTHANNAQRKCQLQYDPKGLLISNQQDNWLITHAYNQQNQRQETQLCSGHTLLFSYNKQGELCAIAINGQQVVSRQLDKLGQEQTRELSGTHRLASSYDGFGRLQQQQFNTGSNSIRCQYHFDDAGQLVTVDDSEQGQKRYLYDNLSQLKQAQYSHQNNQTFDFDSYGNPKQSKVQQDKLIGDDKHSYTYDAFGNQTTASQKSVRQQRIYNGLNQLVRLNHNASSTIYHYDALGRRSAKITAAGQTDFLWEGNQLIGEHNQGEFTWYVYEPNSHRPLLMLKGDAVYHYHLDHLGTPLRLTNQQGTTVWQADYQAYGQIQSLSVNSINNPLRFQGQYFDEESGLHYNHHRYYSPEQGRFIQQDPIGLAGGTNHYQYAPNPITWTDPLGLLCKEGVDKLTRMLNTLISPDGLTEETVSKIIETAANSVGLDGDSDKGSLRLKANGFKNRKLHEYDVTSIDEESNTVTLKKVNKSGEYFETISIDEFAEQHIINGQKVKVDPNSKPTRFHKRTVGEVATAREAFKEAKQEYMENYAKQVLEDPNHVFRSQPCFADKSTDEMNEILNDMLTDGKVPKGFNVHHKVPIFRCEPDVDPNKLANLELLPEEFHQNKNKELHWYEEGKCPYDKDGKGPCLSDLTLRNQNQEQERYNEH